MGRIEIMLSEDAIQYATDVGRTRYRVQRQDGKTDGKVSPTATGETIDIQGAIAELTLANFLGFGWAGALNITDWRSSRTEAGLVGGIRVRATNYAVGGLILHKRDLNIPHVLVNTHRCPTIEIVGWVLPDEVRQQCWWRSDLSRPCYLIPEKFLRTVVATELIAAIPPNPPTPAANTDWTWLPDVSTSLPIAAQQYVAHHFWVTPLFDVQFSNVLRSAELQGKAACTCSLGTQCSKLGTHAISSQYPGCKLESVIRTWSHRPSTRIGLCMGGITRLLAVKTKTVDYNLPKTLTFQTGTNITHFFNVPEGLWMPKSRVINDTTEVICEGGIVAVPPSVQLTQLNVWHPEVVVDVPHWLMDTAQTWA